MKMLNLLTFIFFALLRWLTLDQANRSILVSFPCAMEMGSVHTLSVWAFKVFHIVRSKNLMISNVVLSLALEQETSPNRKLLLKSYQCTNILVILPNMVQ